MSFNTKRNASKMDEVAYVNHQMEFNRFYDNHFKINKEISGFEEVVYFEDGIERTIRITKKNFWYAIKRVQAFIIDNIHYIGRYDDRRKIIEVMNNLEQDFINDKKFKELVEQTSLTAKDEITLSYLYLDYLTRCFKLVNLLGILLRPTLMINTKASKKSITYRDESFFFINLGRYRNDLANDLANFKLGNIVDHFKKVQGYYYTYKVLLVNEEIELIEPILERTRELVNSKEIVNLTLYLRQNETYSENMVDKIKQYVVEIKEILFGIYYLTNTFLSERRVLPKIHTKEVMDFTLI